jgi:ubiquinone/menaquinone biosynthesis C-methylase UbiE
MDANETPATVPHEQRSPEQPATDQSSPDVEVDVRGGQDSDPVGHRPMSVSDVAATYEEYADRLHRFEFADRLLVGRYRRRQFGDATGEVLDVACGTGTNFRYLPEDVDLVGIDVSPDVLAKAEETLDELDRDGTLREMDAQDLAFPDDSFDTVVSALSTCTFPDPVAALREMERVCRPDGEIRLLEHGKSDVGPLARYQEWRADAHYEKMGCRWTQEPLAVAAEAGLNVEASSTGLFGIVTTIRATPRPAGQVR